MDKSSSPDGINPPRFSIRNPFWAGFVHGLLGAWGGSFFAGGITLCALEASYLTYSDLYLSIGSGFGILAGIGFALYTISILQKRRLKSNLQKVSGFGLFCGMAFYISISFLVAWYAFKEPSTPASSTSHEYNTVIIPTTAIPSTVLSINTARNSQTTEETKIAIHSYATTPTAFTSPLPSTASTPVSTSLSMEVNVRGVELLFSAAKKSPYCFGPDGAVTPSPLEKMCLIVFANILYGSMSEIEAIKYWPVTLNHNTKVFYFKIGGSGTNRMAIWQFVINMNETSFILNLPDNININLLSLVT